MASLDDAVWNMLQYTFNNLKPARKHNETKILMTVFRTFTFISMSIIQTCCCDFSFLLSQSFFHPRNSNNKLPDGSWPKTTIPLKMMGMEKDLKRYVRLFSFDGPTVSFKAGCMRKLYQCDSYWLVSSFPQIIPPCIQKRLFCVSFSRLLQLAETRREVSFPRLSIFLWILKELTNDNLNINIPKR